MTTETSGENGESKVIDSEVVREPATPDGGAPEPERTHPQPEAEKPKALMKAPITMGSRGVQFTDFDSLWRFSVAVSRSGMAPKGMEAPETIAVAIEMGLELGLPPMQALQNIAVINGRPGVFGDALAAQVRASGKLAEFREWSEGTFPNDDYAAVCFSRRQGQPPEEAVTTEFSIADAKKAKLWAKDGPWQGYPKRMLQMRARAYNLRDNFPEVVKGFRTVEELRDIPPEKPEPTEPDGAPTVDVEQVKATAEAAGKPRAEALADELAQVAAASEKGAAQIREAGALFEQ